MLSSIVILVCFSISLAESSLAHKSTDLIMEPQCNGASILAVRTTGNDDSAINSLLYISVNLLYLNDTTVPLVRRIDTC